MKPPILQTDWMNRVAFDPDSLAPHTESFFLHAVDPKQPRAFWVRLSLFCDGKERYGETQAILFTESGTQIAKERWALQRVEIDVERAGVAMGESNIQDNASTGLTRGPDFALAWNMTMADEAPAYRPLPASWMYRGQLSTPKFCTPHPCTAVRGQVECWQGLSRRAGLETIDLNGWRGMQGHFWGRQPPERSAWVHCNGFLEAPHGAYFEAFSGGLRVGNVLNPQALMGRLWVDGEAYRFDTWRNVWGAASRFSPTGWTFELLGPQGSLKVTLTANPKQTAALTLPLGSGKPSHAFGNGLASLTLELTPLHGPKRTLHSNRAAFDVTQPAPRGALETAA